MKSLVLFTLMALGISAHAAAASDSITTEGVVDAPVAAVWRAWATTEGLKQWLAPNADIDLRVGGLMRANYDPKGTLTDDKAIENKVLSFEPERMLSIQVAKAPADFPFRLKVGSMWTVLYFQPTSEGKTLVRIVGLGFADDAESQQMRAFFERGNAYTLTNLQRRFQR